MNTSHTDMKRILKEHKLPEIQLLARSYNVDPKIFSKNKTKLELIESICFAYLKSNNKSPKINYGNLDVSDRERGRKK